MILPLLLLLVNVALCSGADPDKEALGGTDYITEKMSGASAAQLKAMVRAAFLLISFMRSLPIFML